MASVTRTVGAAGDHTTIQAALDWLVANWAYAGTDVATVQLLDDAEYTTPTAGLDPSGISGTPSLTSYVIIVPASVSLWCKGAYQNARIANSSGHVVNANADFLFIKGCAIKQAGSGTSNEGARISAENVLFEKCYVEVNNIAQQDCLYAGMSNIIATAFDCVFKLGGSSARGCVHAQANSSSPVVSHVWHIVHCLAIGNGGAFCYGGESHTNSSVTMNLHNCAGFDAVQDFNDETVATRPITMQGNGNISADSSALSQFANTTPNGIGYAQVSLTDVDADGLSYLVQNEAGGEYSLRRGSLTVNIAVGRYESGATVDSRVDDTVDITGRARPASATDRDIGPFQSRLPDGVNPAEFDYDESALTLIGSGFDTSGTVYLSDTNAVGTGTDVDLATGIQSHADDEIVIDMTLLGASAKSAVESLGPGSRFLIVDPTTGADQPFAVTTHRALACELSPTSNISPIGEDTTGQLSAPAGTFFGGRINAELNEGPALDLGNNQNREDEWALQALPGAAAGETYQFRVLLADAPADTITVTPQLTITGGAQQASFSNALSGADAFSVTVNAAASLSETASAQATYTTIANVAAGLVAAASAQDSQGPAASVSAALSEALTGDALIDAVAQAAAAIIEGGTAAESWVESVQATAELTAAGAAAETISASAGGAEQAALAEASAASEAFLAAVTTTAAITGAGSASDAIAALASAIGALSASANAQMTLVATASDANSRSFVATGTAQALWSSVAAVTGALLETLSANAIFTAAGSVAASISASASAQATFSASLGGYLVAGSITVLAALTGTPTVTAALTGTPSVKPQ